MTNLDAENMREMACFFAVEFSAVVVYLVYEKAASGHVGTLSWTAVKSDEVLFLRILSLPYGSPNVSIVNAGSRPNVIAS